MRNAAQHFRRASVATTVAVTMAAAVGCRSVKERDVARVEPILGNRAQIINPYAATTAVAVSTPTMAPIPMGPADGQSPSMFTEQGAAQTFAPNPGFEPTAAAQPSAQPMIQPMIAPATASPAASPQIAAGPGYGNSYGGQVMVAPAQPMMIQPPMDQPAMPMGTAPMTANMPPPFSGPTTGSSFVPAPGSNFPQPQANNGNAAVPLAPGGMGMANFQDGLRNHPNFGGGAPGSPAMQGTPGEVLPASGFLSNGGFSGLKLNPKASPIPVFNGDGAGSDRVPATPRANTPSRPSVPPIPTDSARPNEGKNSGALPLPPPPAPQSKPKAPENKETPPPPPSFEEMPLFRAPPAIN